MREEGPPRTLLHAERRSLHPLAHSNHKHADFLMSRTGRLIHQPFIFPVRARRRVLASTSFAAAGWLAWNARQRGGPGRRVWLPCPQHGVELVRGEGA